MVESKASILGTYLAESFEELARHYLSAQTFQGGYDGLAKACVRQLWLAAA